MEHWICHFQNEQDAAKAVASLGGALSYFSWQKDGTLFLKPIPGKEFLVKKTLKEQANNPNPGIIK